MATHDDLLARLQALEDLLAQENLRESLASAHTLALSIARDAKSATVVELAAKVIAAIEELKGTPDNVRTEDIPLQKALWRLRLALAAAKRDDPTPP